MDEVSTWYETYMKRKDQPQEVEIPAEDITTKEKV
jgi:hypothetical protein